MQSVQSMKNYTQMLSVKRFVNGLQLRLLEAKGCQEERVFYLDTRLEGLSMLLKQVYTYTSKF